MLSEEVVMVERVNKTSDFATGHCRSDSVGFFKPQLFPNLNQVVIIVTMMTNVP